MASIQLATQKKNFDSFARTLLKISSKTFHRKTYFTEFFEFVYNTLSKIATTLDIFFFL